MNLLVLLVFGCVLIETNGHSNIVFQCTTPNREKAVCISLFACPVLMKSLGSLHPSAIDFVEKSICGTSTGTVKVCCGSSGNFGKLDEGSQTSTLDSCTSIENSTERKLHRDYVRTHLIPTENFCGMQHVDVDVDDRPRTGNNIAFDEFPWMVHIESLYDTTKLFDGFEHIDRCSGVLISNQYVLTTVYCAIFSKAVRLGQHRTNETVSCVDDPMFPECTESVVIDIEDDAYRRDLRSSWWHDFALLRLAKKVSYSDYVRPICLPINDTSRAFRHESLMFSGWGALEQGGVVKKKLTYSSVDVHKCYNLSKWLEEDGNHVDVACLFPSYNNTEMVCAGDEGGPLMFSVRRGNLWFVDGLIAKVFYNSSTMLCSNDQPIAGIRLTEDILDWILENMKP